MLPLQQLQPTLQQPASTVSDGGLGLQLSSEWVVGELKSVLALQQLANTVCTDG